METLMIITWILALAFGLMLVVLFNLDHIKSWFKRNELRLYLIGTVTILLLFILLLDQIGIINLQ